MISNDARVSQESLSTHMTHNYEFINVSTNVLPSASFNRRRKSILEYNRSMAYSRYGYHSSTISKSLLQILPSDESKYIPVPRSKSRLCKLCNQKDRGHFKCHKYYHMM